MLTILPIVQVVSAVLLTIVVLFQNREGGAGGIMGGGGSVDTSFYTRRGFDNFLFYSTIVLAVIFAGSAMMTFFV